MKIKCPRERFRAQSPSRDNVLDIMQRFSLYEFNAAQIPQGDYVGKNIGDGFDINEARVITAHERHIEIHFQNAVYVWTAA